MERGWREKVGELVTEHNRDGVGCVIEDGKTGGDQTEVHHLPVEELRVKGKALHPKAVKVWLWANRTTAAAADLLYSWYDPEQDISLVGLGTLVERSI